MPAEIPPALPEKKVYPVIEPGVYQAVIADVESGKQKPYDQRFDTNAADSEPFYVFKFKILTPGAAQGRFLWSKRGKACLPVPPEGKAKESLVFRVASAVTGRKLTYDEGKNWSLADINALTGKQIILVVEQATRQDGSDTNSITTFMHAREVLPDIDEAAGGGETKSVTPSVVSTPPTTTTQVTPERYDSVPPEFRPKPNEVPGGFTGPSTSV